LIFQIFLFSTASVGLSHDSKALFITIFKTSRIIQTEDFFTMVAGHFPTFKWKKSKSPIISSFIYG